MSRVLVQHYPIQWYNFFLKLDTKNMIHHDLLLELTHDTALVELFQDYQDIRVLKDRYPDYHSFVHHL